LVINGAHAQQLFCGDSQSKRKVIGRRGASRPKLYGDKSNVVLLAFQLTAGPGSDLVQQSGTNRVDWKIGVSG
jgi:hypothetical protein